MSITDAGIPNVSPAAVSIPVAAAEAPSAASANAFNANTTIITPGVPEGAKNESLLVTPGVAAPIAAELKQVEKQENKLAVKEEKLEKRENTLEHKVAEIESKLVTLTTQVAASESSASANPVQVCAPTFLNPGDNNTAIIAQPPVTNPAIPTGTVDISNCTKCNEHKHHHHQPITI